jgi:hypothetical protein
MLSSLTYYYYYYCGYYLLLLPYRALNLVVGGCVDDGLVLHWRWRCVVVAVLVRVKYRVF